MGVSTVRRHDSFEIICTSPGEVAGVGGEGSVDSGDEREDGRRGEAPAEVPAGQQAHERGRERIGQPWEGADGGRMAVVVTVGVLAADRLDGGRAVRVRPAAGGPAR
jgi:hypothetical protein